MKTHRWLTSVAVLVGVVAVQATPIISDDFNDNSTNPALWSVFTWGSGPTVAEQNGRVEITVPSGSAGGSFGSGYVGIPLLVGDFDAELEYSLLSSPPSNGVRLGIGLEVFGPVVGRGSFSTHDFLTSGEYYYTHFSDGVQGVTATDHQNGKLRVTRSGSVLSGYYWSGQSWVLIHQGPAPVSPTHFVAVVWSHDGITENQPVQVAFDNFRLTTTPETPRRVPDHGDTLVNLAAAFAGLLLIARRRIVTVPQH